MFQIILSDAYFVELNLLLLFFKYGPVSSAVLKKTWYCRASSNAWVYFLDLV